MTPEKLRQARELFDAAISVPEGERASFIDQRCAEDDELAELVRSLLALDGQTHDPLEGVAHAGGVVGQTPPFAMPAHFESLAGRSVGRYRLDRLIGVGGMSVVYLAQQNDPSREVALKLIPPGITSRRLLRRLHEEAQTLARLHHPCIAQIFEAGSADLGYGEQPFFAMEYVRGQSLLEYARAKESSVFEKIELLARLCDGVQHAHQRGVIHRDLKPANILVDSTGRPRIIDFGIARSTNLDTQRTTLQVTENNLVGTLRYMSPEQLTGRAEDLDTRSDIYSLGVIAYELLTGRYPYELQDRPVGEIIRIISEQEPTRIHAIDRRLRGDIETIVDKALAKDREQRYQTAADFAGDLRRYLANEPILARPASVIYQLRKYAGRNRAAAAAMVTTLVVLVGGIVGTSLALQVAMQQQRAAESNLAEAEVTLEFFEKVLSAPRPDALGREVTARHVLDEASEMLDGEFANLPLVQARLHRVIGTAYVELGEHDSAETHLIAAHDLATEHMDPDDERRITSIVDLATVYMAQRRFKEGEEMAVRAQRECERVLGPDHRDTLHSMNLIGGCQLKRGRFDEAKETLSETLDRSRAALGDRHVLTLTVLNTLGLVHLSLEDFEAAHALLDESLTGRREVLGSEHPSTLTSMHNAAMLCLDVSRLADAEALLSEVLELRRKVLGQDHPNTFNTEDNLGVAFFKQQRFEEAHAVLERVLQARRRVLGNDDPATQDSGYNAAGALYRMHRYEAASELFQEFLEIRLRTHGRDDTQTLLLMNKLAASARNAGRFDDAIEATRQSLNVRREVLGDEHSRTLSEQNNLAATMFARGEYESARILLEQTVEARRRTLGEDHRDVYRTTSYLARVYAALGRVGEAESLFTEALEARRRILGEEHLHTLVSMFDLAGFRLDGGEVELAAPLAVKSFEIALRTFGDNHQQTAIASVVLGRVEAAQGDDARAEEHLRQAVEIGESIWGERHPTNARFKYRLAEFLVGHNRSEEARPLLQAAHDILTSSVTPEHRLRIKCEQLAAAMDKRRSGAAR